MARTARQRHNYRLDHMYLNTGSIWPTWTWVPALADNVGIVHTITRIFYTPTETEVIAIHEGYNPIFRRYGGPPVNVWLFYRTLRVFLQCGSPPWPGDEEEGTLPGMTIHKLINALSAIEPGVVLVEYPPSFRRTNFNIWGHF
ncbi:transcriptional regulatory protein [Tolypocladium capitatum]|uniref:Transcriptional regulatory protein n=1 Tax=Tolypocladium capitatum TaxID=45235 RepID=A0A2K3QH75_9HYPO|nr:transcriptional regulatory protein [Tolypocladium capitatum]